MAISNINEATRNNLQSNDTSVRTPSSITYVSQSLGTNYNLHCTDAFIGAHHKPISACDEMTALLQLKIDAFGYHVFDILANI